MAFEDSSIIKSFPLQIEIDYSIIIKSWHRVHIMQQTE